jgi:glucose-1-phosphate cytidylyltransferase
MTAVSPPPRFGNIEIEDGMVTRMSEKKEKEPSWINGGFFVFNNSIKNYLTKDEPFEQTPLINLAQQNQLSAYKHTGYWQCVDTIRELEILESDIDSEKIIV